MILQMAGDCKIYAEEGGLVNFPQVPKDKTAPMRLNYVQ
ncbi:hypothetical protein SA508_01495 [Aggregatibacter actinomycetemcomitans serotype d str. SA508]|nr:hypothetical protein SA2876_09815 [Aggregatibacter actinomycetemcomitans serotype e str. SA2876]KYK89002.1 hypothetical protein SC29R_01140 [Aggregatibacter actinomycetemcomitans serotype f str. SC29R]KYK91074.1 hypothetical protein SA508_01495 [Aggregatibacter actinomycetemcomitans serotype d str. SA508]KYK93520.1 hypothetical protein SA269_03245 [Aggregatibacter actinomycetemcomitans serotype d str. SA269]